MTHSNPRPHRWPHSPAWSASTRLWVFTLMIATIVLIWWNVRQFTVLVLMALLLAYILNPAIEWVRSKLRRSRAVATLLVYTCVALLLFLGPALAAPSVVASVGSFDVKEVWNTIFQELVPILPARLNLLGQTFELTPAYYQFDRDLQAMVASMMSGNAALQILGIATNVAFGVFGFFVVFTTSLYVALDKDRVFDWIEGKVPVPYFPVYTALRRDIDGVWQSFFRGQLILALVIGVMTTIGLVILGVPYAVPLGIVAGVLEVVPRVGPVLSVLPALVVALVQPASLTFPDLPRTVFVVLVAGMYILVQQFENNLLVPRILGSSVNLPPAVVLVGALAGATVAGVPGILLAAPILGTIRVIGSWLFHQVTRVEENEVVLVVGSGNLPEAPKHRKDDLSA